MSEERKIITEIQWAWGASYIGWVDLEPAPPKNWEPLCFRTGLLETMGASEILYEAHRVSCPKRDECNR